MATPEKVILSFSVKNPEKDSHYQIKVINEELSLGKCGEFETEDKKCIEVQNEIVKILDAYTSSTDALMTKLTEELEACKKQYEYYRDALFSFAAENEEVK